MTRHALKFGSALMALALGLWMPGLARGFSQITDNAGGKGNIIFAHWDDADLPVLYYVDPGGSGIPGVDARQFVERCFAPWNNVATSRFKAFYGGVAPDYDGDGNITIADIDWKADIGPVPFPSPALYPNYPAGSYRNDGRVEIIFDDTGEFFDRTFGPDSGILGLTFPLVEPSTGRLLDADIIVNVPVAKTRPEIELEATLVHEIGHLAGLGHSGLFRSVPLSKLPTMYPYMRPDVKPEDVRTLEPDDDVSLSIVYPTDDWSSSTARIRGTVRQFNRLPAFGAQVGVINEANGYSIATIAGYYTGDTHTGWYELPGLPPGAYKVFVESIDGSREAGYVSGLNISVLLISTYRWVFPREFFNNVVTQADATVFNVQAGQTVNGVDIILGTENGGEPLAVNQGGGESDGCSSTVYPGSGGGNVRAMGLTFGVLLAVPAFLRLRRRRV